MRTLRLTGAETGDQLIKQLVLLRAMGRQIAKASKEAEAAIREWERVQAECPTETGAASLQHANEVLFEAHFMEIEVGRYLFGLCAALDQKASREQIFDAINTNRADRDTDMVREYGAKSHQLICVLDLENSASTRDEDWTDPEVQPLKWCHTRAFMHELQTNSKLDKAIHERTNEFLDGQLGEFRERSLVERLAGRTM